MVKISQEYVVDDWKYAVNKINGTNKSGINGR
jgi:hypothetical protein